MTVTGKTLHQVDQEAFLKVVNDLCSKVDDSIPGLRKRGFDFQGINYQADPGVTESVNGVLTALNSGIVVEFPLAWRSGNNDRPSWPDIETFKSFGGALLTFVQQLYSKAWTDKDAIRSATTTQEAQSIFDAGPWGLVE